jgi:hypothetical protein
MKYCTRTVTWRFRDSTETIPELADVSRLSVHSPEDVVKNYRSLFKDHVRKRIRNRILLIIQGILLTLSTSVQQLTVFPL